MIGDCFCAVQSKKAINHKSKYYRLISNRLHPEQIVLLGFIFEDLAVRTQPETMISYDNFVNFFGLTGLWAYELFRIFDQKKNDAISFEQFLYGVCKKQQQSIGVTIKAPEDEKIKLLYSFFANDIKLGIQFKNFVKMLYNYSKDQLKQILLDQIQIPTYQTCTQQSSSSFDLTQKIYELKSPLKNCKKTSTFEEAYKTLIKVHDEGTYLQINNNSLNYKIRYINMSTHVKQFAQKVYNEYKIDINGTENNLMTFEQFAHWIRLHKKLYRSFFSAFHQQIWTYYDETLSYVHCKPNNQFVGRIQSGKIKEEVYGMQIQDMIVFCQNSKGKRKPIKIICLEGLTISDYGNLSIEISHRSDYYKNCLMIFKREEDHHRWMESLKQYQKESLNLNYLIGQVIGTGKFSTVYKCKNRITKKTYALKAVDLRKLAHNALQAIRNQSEILKITNHPQVVKYHETISTKTHEYIITEYIYGEDLFEYVRKRKYLNQFESAFIIGNIMKAVMYLHELDILHRDLKPENIMVMFKEKKVDEYFQSTIPEMRKGQRIQNIKIIDFGLSDHLTELAKLDKKKLLAGTPNYIAPEIILEQELTLKSDIFSIGSILYFLLKGTLPFAELNAERTLLNTIRGSYDLQSQHWDMISHEAKDLLIGLLNVDPNERIELKQAVNHQWFNCISMRAKTKSSTSSVSDTNESQKKSLNQLDDIKTNQFQYKKSNQRKSSTSLTKQKSIDKSRQSK